MKTQTSGITKALRGLVVIISLAIGVAIVANFVLKKQPPERVAAVERMQPVYFMETASLPFVTEVSGFGLATPGTTWSAISNVKGHVIYRHDGLESGALINVGTLLLEIDPEIYHLALAEAEAEIDSINAEIAQLQQEATNAEALLELERQRLDLSEAELERTQSLVASGAVPRASLDTQTRAALQQRQAVQSLVNQLNILPIQLDRLGAQKARALSKVAQVRYDIEDTKIIAPFDIRIGEVSVEMYQYINPGQLLFSADGIKTAEVILQVPMQNLRRVLEELPETGSLADLADISAYVTLVGEDQVWEAQVSRIANGIDPATRTVRVVLEVEQPDSGTNVFDHPPLPKGMYVEGVLRYASTDPLIIIPQQAIHEGWVYLVDDDNRLERRAVVAAFQQKGMVVIESGLNAGDKVILDDIVPAISGMLLDPQRNAEAEQSLRSLAIGLPL